MAGNKGLLTRLPMRFSPPSGSFVLSKLPVLMRDKGACLRFVKNNDHDRIPQNCHV